MINLDLTVVAKAMHEGMDDVASLTDVRLSIAEGIKALAAMPGAEGCRTPQALSPGCRALS